ncbi:MAG: hypothetical protein K2W92_07790, partial [Alphaproteobacteria bacterium]|nr:hypothetical protein [Alphaproteobacteria bacterium]
NFKLVKDYYMKFNTYKKERTKIYPAVRLLKLAGSVKISHARFLWGWVAVILPGCQALQIGYYF